MAKRINTQTRPKGEEPRNAALQKRGVHPGLEDLTGPQQELMRVALEGPFLYSFDSVSWEVAEELAGTLAAPDLNAARHFTVLKLKSAAARQCAAACLITPPTLQLLERPEPLVSAARATLFWSAAAVITNAAPLTWKRKTDAPFRLLREEGHHVGHEGAASEQARILREVLGFTRVTALHERADATDEALQALDWVLRSVGDLQEQPTEADQRLLDSYGPGR